jgi:hypothetical protein
MVALAAGPEPQRGPSSPDAARDVAQLRDAGRRQRGCGSRVMISHSCRVASGGLCETLLKEVQADCGPERGRERFQGSPAVGEKDPPGLQLGGSALDDEVLKPRRVQARVQVCLRQRENPDTRKLSQRFAVRQDVVLELLEAAAQARSRRPCRRSGVIGSARTPARRWRFRSSRSACVIRSACPAAPPSLMCPVWGHRDTQHPGSQQVRQDQFPTRPAGAILIAHTLRPRPATSPPTRYGH